jgi:hypothetical protein
MIIRKRNQRQGLLGRGNKTGSEGRSWVGPSELELQDSWFKLEGEGYRGGAETGEGRCVDSQKMSQRG